LTKLKENVEDHLTTVDDAPLVKNVVITVPACFNQSQRQATLHAASMAGLDVVRLASEPVATAISHSRSDQELQGNVLFYDMGGGALDVSLISIEDDIVEMKSTAGDSHLGGDDFDDRIVEYCVQDFKRKNRGMDLFQYPDVLHTIRGYVEHAKWKLCEAEEVVIDIDDLVRAIDYSTSLSRQRFENLTRDLFDKAVSPLTKVLQDGGVKREDVSRVVLFGGSTRMPLLRRKIEEFFNGQTVERPNNSEDAVVRGATWLAASLARVESVEGKEVLALDVTPLSMTLQSGDNSTSLFTRNSLLPTQRKKQLLETGKMCERAAGKENISWGELKIESKTPAARPEEKQVQRASTGGFLSGFSWTKSETNSPKKKKAGVQWSENATDDDKGADKPEAGPRVQAEVELWLDENGILKAAASGSEIVATFEKEAVLSEAGFQKALKRSQDFNHTDAPARQVSVVRAQIKMYCEALTKATSAKGLSNADIKKCFDESGNIADWLRAQKSMDPKVFKDRFAELRVECDNILEKSLATS